MRDNSLPPMLAGSPIRLIRKATWVGRQVKTPAGCIWMLKARKATIQEDRARLPEGKITEEGLEKLRSLMGTNLRISNIFNELASKEAVRNYANGIGDPNPLWRDEEYAEKSRYGRIAAPPSWLYSVFPTFVPLGLPGVHAFHSGNDWEFYKPVLCGDQIRPECELIGFDQKTGKFAGDIIIVNFEARFIISSNFIFENHSPL